MAERALVQDKLMSIRMANAPSLLKEECETCEPNGRWAQEKGAEMRNALQRGINKTYAID